MKKFLVIAATAAIALTGCLREPESGVKPLPAGYANLTIKVATPARSNETRAIEAPGSDVGGTIQASITSLYLGHIFVVDASGNVAQSVAMTSAALGVAGQTLTSPVQTGQQVYVFANIPANDYDAFKACTTLGAIQGFASAMYYDVAVPTVAGQPDYKRALLGNLAPVTVGTPSNPTEPFKANVGIKPLISRIELHAVKAKAADDAVGKVTKFTVTGVYLDSYYHKFVYGGSFYDDPTNDTYMTNDPSTPDIDESLIMTGNPDIFEQGGNTTFTGRKDEKAKDAVDAWKAVTDGTNMVATPDMPLTPGVSEIWAHNVAAGSLPRFILKLEDVEWTRAGDATPITPGTPYYVTIKNYTGVTAFAPGKIYKISGLEFGPADWSALPNPEEVNLNVAVTITEWEIEELPVEL